ncbi:hypothetical protein NDU88_006514 [Pleurodeles waltl]|uniref:Uncharacterized protein n=1 Tax=Pleurodeles waltl TaxID=8319 RepID=A0AAV7TDR3_PLEWA|nr:hypothetical protein NDU88_006514 [Pleurodeles waltl]
MLPWERFHGGAGIRRLPRQPPMTRAQRIGQREAKDQGFPRRREERRTRREERRTRREERRTRREERRTRREKRRTRREKRRTRREKRRTRTEERRRRTEERRARRKAAAAVGEGSHTIRKATPRTEGGPAGRELVETTPGKTEWYRSPRGPDQTTAGPETNKGTSIEPATAPEGRGSGRTAPASVLDCQITLVDLLALPGPRSMKLQDPGKRTYLQGFLIIALQELWALELITIPD